MVLEEENKVIEIPEEKEPSSLRLIVSLSIAGFLSGLLLVTVYLLTKPVIEANRAAALQEAIYKVLPDCASFKPMVLSDGKLIEYSLDPSSKQKGEEPMQIYAGFNAENKFIGFAIPGAVTGFQDIISALFGYDPERRLIVGYEILESKETPGLGDKIFKDAAFVANFLSLSVEPEIVCVKAGEKKNPNEVDAITGATISSKAVVKLLNNSVQQWKEATENFIINNGGEIATSEL